MSPSLVVLLHGFAGSPQSWDRVTALMPPDTPVFRPALCGHGRVPVAAATFHEEVERLASVLRKEGVSGAVLVGYSLGGRVALGLLVRHAELFEQAVILGASPGLADDAARAERVSADEAWALMLERDGLQAFVDAWERLPLFESQRGLDAEVLEEQRRIRLSHAPAGLASAMRVLGLGKMPNLLPELGRVQVPVQFVAGELDGKYRGQAAVMATAVAGARTRVVAGRGHNVVLEDPAAVAALWGKESST